MFSILSLTLRLVAARWPQLLAWFLAGWLARFALIEVAAFFGATSALVGLLIMPLAILARLGSYIGMFFCLRDVMPSFRQMTLAGTEAIEPRVVPGDAPGAGPGRQRIYDVLLSSILPFFAFYAAWQLLKEDTDAYALSALSKIDYFNQDAPRTDNVLSLQLSPATVAVIIIAFAGRFLIKRYADRLPRWMNLVAVYFESIWVYLTIFLLSNYLGAIRDWVDSRAAAHWVGDFRETVSGFFAPIGWAWSGIEWLVAEVGALALLPLAWLTLAGIVYGRSLAMSSLRIRPRNRYYERVASRFTARYAALPEELRTRAADVGSQVTGRWSPLVNAVVLIWRAGVASMGLFILGYTVLEAARVWLSFAALRIIGPHDLYSWWMNLDGMLSFGVSLVIDPLQLCLIAAAYDYCLRKLGERRAARDLDAVGVPDAAPAGAAGAAPQAAPETATETETETETETAPA